MAKNPTGLASIFPKSPNRTTTKGTVFSARVRLLKQMILILQVFNQFGEWSSIGCIFFDSLNEP